MVNFPTTWSPAAEPRLSELLVLPLLAGAYQEEYGIPARMFNVVRVSLDGKVSAVASCA